MFWIVSLFVFGVAAQDLMHPFTVSLKPGVKECFYAQVTKVPVNITWMFEVNSGNVRQTFEQTKDVTARQDFFVQADIQNTDGFLVYSMLREDDFVEFEVLKPGESSLCVTNPDSSGEEKMMGFNVLIEQDFNEAGGPKTEDEAEIDEIHNQLDEIEEKVPSIVSTVRVTVQIDSAARMVDKISLSFRRHSHLMDEMMTSMQMWQSAKTIALFLVVFWEIRTLKGFFSNTIRV